MANTPDESKVVSLADPRDARGKVVSPAAVGEARRDMKRLLGFNLERFIYGLPHTRPEGRNYERRDGGIRFLFSSHMEDGVPFGHDRLLTIWLAAAYEGCGRLASGLIHVDSLGDIPKAFGVPTRSSHHTALERSLLRLSSVTLDVSVSDERPHSRVVAIVAGGNRRRYHLIQGVDLLGQHENWPTHGPPGGLVILLSEHLVTDLQQRVLPLELSTVGALRNNLSALDLYVWQAHRSWELHQRRVPLLAVPVLGSDGLLVELGAAVEDEEEALRRLRTNQELVQEAWQDCPNRLIEDGRRLVLRPCEALGKERPPLPGVSASPRIRHLGIVSSSPPPQADGGPPPVPPGAPEEEWT